MLIKATHLHNPICTALGELLESYNRAITRGRGGLCRCNRCLVNTEGYILRVSRAVAGELSFSYTAIINTLYAILAF